MTRPEPLAFPAKKVFILPIRRIPVCVSQTPRGCGWLSGPPIAPPLAFFGTSRQVHAQTNSQARSPFGQVSHIPSKAGWTAC